MVAPTTALDALVAELLGDVGKLHAEMKALSEAVPAMVSVVESATAGAEQRLNAVVSKLETQTEIKSSERIVLPRLMLFGVLLAAGCSGGIVAIASLRFLAPTSLLGMDSSRTYQSGQYIERAWPHLDDATQKAIEKAAGN